MKNERALTLLMVATLVLGVEAGQQQAQPQDQPRVAKPQPNIIGMDPEPREMTSNVQVEVSISDSAGSAAPQKKTVSLVTAGGNMGRVRAQRGNAAVLNVDATPRLQKDGRIALQLAVEYRPAETAETLGEMSPINEFLTVLLHSGKPLVVTQAADPSSDRKVTVEVTATILK
jgi:hypothetical protein